MNFFEGELHRMFGGNDIIHDPKIVGRTLLGKLDDDLRVKLQFVSTGVHKHYDAIQISILNRTDGVVDKETMLFGDIIGVKNTNISGRVNPYMWEEGVGKAYWYTPVSVSEKHRSPMPSSTTWECTKAKEWQCPYEKFGKSLDIR